MSLRQFNEMKDDDDSRFSIELESRRNGGTNFCDWVGQLFVVFYRVCVVIVADGVGELNAFSGFSSDVVSACVSTHHSGLRVRL